MQFQYSIAHALQKNIWDPVALPGCMSTPSTIIGCLLPARGDWMHAPQGIYNLILNLILRSFKNGTSTLGDPSGEESDAAVYQLTKSQWLSVS